MQCTIAIILHTKNMDLSEIVLPSHLFSFFIDTFFNMLK